MRDLVDIALNQPNEKKVEKMNWKIISIILVVILAAVAVSGCIGSPVSDADDKITADDSANITEDGTYDTKDEVAAYIIKYHKLPSNYITKSEARSLGWHGGPVYKVAPGKCMGGDTFTNRQEVLPSGEHYIECDINTLDADSRGAERIVYSSDDFDVYYTSDHYETFEKLN